MAGKTVARERVTALVQVFRDNGFTGERLAALASEAARWDVAYVGVSIAGQSGAYNGYRAGLYDIMNGLFGDGFMDTVSAITTEIDAGRGKLRWMSRVPRAPHHYYDAALAPDPDETYECGCGNHECDSYDRSVCSCDGDCDCHD